MEEKTQKGTFVVRISHTQNESWQGTVTWTEGGRRVSFRSAMELMMLLDSALDGTEGTARKKNRSQPRDTAGDTQYRTFYESDPQK